MALRVECYSGYKVNERPVRFFLGQRKFEVKELLDRWYGEDHDYFKLLADDLSTYVLKYNRYDDRWELIFYAAPDLPTSIREELFDFVQAQSGLPPEWPN